MRLPPPLGPGARVALVAPSGPLRSPEQLDTACQQARAFGWEPVVGAHALATHGYLAGTDQARLTDLNTALADDAMDGIWCLRGGYGAMRLLQRLDTESLRRRPRTVIGYSDITALHAAFGRAANLVTFHGPTARTPLTPFSRASLANAVVDRGEPCGHAAGARVVRHGGARGRLAGGNLALLSALVGTPYSPDYTGAIVVLEDVGEATYRIDRMLRQLMLSGAWAGIAGLVFGQFTDGTDQHDTTSLRLEDLLAEVAETLGVPAIAGAPIGHIDEQWTIPLGATAEFDAGRCMLQVDWH